VEQQAKRNGIAYEHLVKNQMLGELLCGLGLSGGNDGNDATAHHQACGACDTLASGALGGHQAVLAIYVGTTAVR
jgi:hypothetical protein